MDELDKTFVDGMRSRGDEDKEIYNLLGIIDDLDKQLTKVVEAGEPFRVMADLIKGVPHAELLGRTYLYHNYSKEVWFGLGISSARGKRPFVDTKITGANFCRLAQALKEVRG